MTYHIGKTPRDIVGDPIEWVDRRTGEVHSAAWHVVTVRPMTEARTVAIFRTKGVYGFYPSEKRTRTIRGKRVSRRHPIVTGIVYAKFKRQPQWDVMKARRLITGLFQDANSEPIIIDTDAIKIFRGIETTAERMERLRQEAAMIRPGDRCIITEGSFPPIGTPVIATKVRGDRVGYYVFTQPEIKGTIKMKGLEKC